MKFPVGKSGVPVGTLVRGVASYVVVRVVAGVEDGPWISKLSSN
jgi:hypothetical protein